ncbi:MAG: DUF368 domain-containing protein [Anaerovoracaceae bacterium]|jgi:putative membrane protein
MKYINQLRLFVYGIILGISNVIPGVSGGTMAVILNIYDDILYAISWKNFKRHASFLGLLGAGCIVGILLFSHTVTFLLQNYEMPVYYCFMGLVLGSIPMIYKRARHEKVKPRNFIIFILSLSFMLFITLIDQGTITGNTLEVTDNPGFRLYLWLFVAAVISTIAMILPGISGSLIMLLLGAYTITLEAISEMDLLTLLPVGLGVLLGGFLGLKFVKTLLRFHPQALYFGILGLIIGSLFTIYPGYPAGAEGALCLILTAFFAVVAYFFSVKN